MRSEAIAYTLAGMCFGIILGWVIGTQQASMGPSAQQVQAAPAAATASAQAQRPVRPLDEARVRSLSARLEANPRDGDAAVELAGVYFDAERWDDAIAWYERAVDIDPANADASTDLGVSYFVTGRPDRAIEQFDRVLRIDPAHTKAMLNRGLALALGREDLRGATEEWKRVVALAPGSEEGEQARRLLESLASGHGGDTAPVPE